MDWLFYTLLAVIFMGPNTFIVKKLTKTIKCPQVVLFYQFLTAVIVVFSYVLITGFSDLSVFALLLGVAYFIALTLFYFGLSKGDLSKASPVFNMNLLVTAVLGLVVLGEQLTFNVIIGLGLGVLGIYLLGGESK
ncbi:MAG: DMT family transporter [Candidatus Nanoarchaeia archaeon]|jgi:transporter family protein